MRKISVKAIMEDGLWVTSTIDSIGGTHGDQTLAGFKIDSYTLKIGAGVFIEGKEVFENDIVEYDNTGFRRDPHLEEVIWDSGHSRWAIIEHGGDPSLTVPIDTPCRLLGRMSRIIGNTADPEE